jgi:membrane AbrB-like protein
MASLIMTLLVGLIGGLIALRLKIPAGAMIGSMLAVAVFNILTGSAYFPQNIKIVTQIAAGAFIGAGIKKKDVLDLKYMLKPAVLMVTLMITLDLFMGYLMHKASGIDLITALFAAAPAGVVDMSLISDDMGADSSKVAVLQLVRLMSVMIILPPLIKALSCKDDSIKVNDEQVISKKEAVKPEKTKRTNAINLTITMVTAFTLGLIGYVLKVPAGTITFSMASVGALNIVSGRGYMPLNLRRFTQVCAGALIGSRMSFSDLLALRIVIVPAFILLVGIILVNLFIGYLISKVGKIGIVTSLLASAPGGLSDMALIAKDLGGDSPKVAILQLSRYICIIGIFPIIIKLITKG